MPQQIFLHLTRLQSLPQALQSKNINLIVYKINTVVIITSEISKLAGLLVAKRNVTLIFVI